MKTANKTIYLYAETPLHVGTGAGLGAVDLPIQREKHTSYPIIQASGVKGALRDTAELKLKDLYGEDAAEIMIKSIFGGSSGSDDHAGAISPSDARILCFPVRALNGVFVWISSPIVLERYQRETDVKIGVEIPSLYKEDQENPDKKIPLALVSNQQLKVGGKVMLEEFTYDIAEENNAARKWAEHIAACVFADDKYWRERMEDHFIVLPDNEFRDFVRYSTEIVTRIHIDDETKTVKKGQLFTQELLPADSLLYSFLKVTDTRDQRIEADTVIEELRKAIKDTIQIGADETVGRGRMRLSWEK
jgi:CRISPR-associated protein Cmr4